MGSDRPGKNGGEEPPQRTRPTWRKPPRPSRKLNLASRVRGRFRRWSDRVLGASLAWSVTLVGVSLLLLASQRCGGELYEFRAGEIAPTDIVATASVNITDRELTEARRTQARAEVPDVFVHATQRRFELARDLSKLFSWARETLEATPAGEAAAERARTFPAYVMPLLEADGYSVALEHELSQALSHVMRNQVVGNKAVLLREDRIVLVQAPGGSEQELADFSAIIDLEQLKEDLDAELVQRLPFEPEQVEALSRFAATFLDANVHLDPEASHLRREREAQAVPPVTTQVVRGDVLVREGERLTDETVALLDEARRAAQGVLGLQEFTVLLFIMSMLAFFLFRYCRYHQRDFSKLEHLHALLVLMLVSTLLLTRAMLWIAAELVDSLIFPFDQLQAYTYLIPLGAGAILVALLANGRIATVYSAFTALLFGALNGDDYYLMLWAVLVQLSGVYAISTYRERSALLRAGLVVGGAGAFAALGMQTLRGELEPLGLSMYSAGLAFVGGAVGVGLLVSFLLPMLESLFNVLTDIRLLELSNLNNPLLSELAVKAPGSYNHSLVVGTLAEEGARAIGGNSLFCRVSAFYHDIGKSKHPEYYVENQRGGNPHERMKPSMSALVIASHVKDGIKMAREAGLPEQIVDIIPQHHGTKLMVYFYEKARAEADPSMGPIKEEDFRYPGPKPQTREAAIFMLADAVEAAARTIEDPTPNRLREMIRKLTNSIVLDGQFDSCDLTFSDLEKIQQAFVRLLVSMYHHRVDYPGFDFNKDKDKDKDKDEAKPAPAAGEPKAARGA